MVSPKVLPLTSVRNPRDLGGYPAADGKVIKSHRLLRTGKMSHLTAKDQQFLQSYGLVQVVDLRTKAECQKSGDPAIAGVKHYNISASSHDNTQAGKSLQELEKQYRLDPLAGFRQMCQSYHDSIVSSHAQHAYHDLFELLAATKEGATIFHCSEGKDRTGLVTVLLLHLLGVAPEVIRQDYLFSNPMLDNYRFQRDQAALKTGANLNTRACLRSLGSVANEYLDTALITVQDNYSDLDSYLSKQIGVTSSLKAELRKLYLEA
jgi:protein-tyrosine phosphatase